jgi:hypothetical protein
VITKVIAQAATITGALCLNRLRIFLLVKNASAEIEKKETTTTKNRKILMTAIFSLIN